MIICDTGGNYYIVSGRGFSNKGIVLNGPESLLLNLLLGRDDRDFTADVIKQLNINEAVYEHYRSKLTYGFVPRQSDEPFSLAY
jgi:hypothetical protein